MDATLSRKAITNTAMIRIYHNPQCKKSRAGLAYLQNTGLAFEVVEYTKKPLTAGALKQIIRKSGLKATDLIRTQEEVYKKSFKGLEMSEDQWIQVLVEHPRLLKRPIVECDDQAVWADPPDAMQNLLNLPKNNHA